MPKLIPNKTFVNRVNQKNGSMLASFSCQYVWWYTLNVPMIGCEQRTSGAGSDRSINLVITTAPWKIMLPVIYHRQIDRWVYCKILNFTPSETDFHSINIWEDWRLFSNGPSPASFWSFHKTYNFTFSNLGINLCFKWDNPGLFLLLFVLFINTFREKWKIPAGF